MRQIIKFGQIILRVDQKNLIKRVKKKMYVSNLIHWKGCVGQYIRHAQLQG